MKYLITTSNNTGDWFNKDIALINVTESFLEEVRRARDFLITAPEEFKGRATINLYPFNTLFYDSTCVDGEDRGNLDIKVIQEWIEGNMPTKFIDIEDIDNLETLVGELKYTEGVTCRVSNYGVRFTSYPKHSDEEIFTDDISFDELGL